MSEIVEVHFRENVLGVILDCRFVLQVEIVENSKDLKLISQDSLTDRYNVAINFTIDCFKSIFKKIYPNSGAIITIFRMGAFDVDTRNMVIFYVLLLALCKSINYNLEGFTLDNTRGVLIIPAIL